MRYSKRDLRNRNRPLLRRVQRMVDKQNEEKIKTISDTNLNIIASPAIEGFEDEKDSLFSVFEKKKTRVGRYKKRGHKSW